MMNLQQAPEPGSVTLRVQGGHGPGLPGVRALEFSARSPTCFVRNWAAHLLFPDDISRGNNVYVIHFKCS